jgi:hypothetical protein
MSPSLDPYVVRGTWTREELLRARGITPERPAGDDRRPKRRAA